MTSKYINNFTFDIPITFKNITIYPATIQDYYSFYYFSQCLTIDKNADNNLDVNERIKVIQMTYLDYLFYLAKENNLEYLESNPNILWFIELLKIVTKNKLLQVNLSKLENGRACFYIENQLYTDEDFEQLKDIISEWNLVDLPDLSISKALRDKLTEAKNYRAKLSKQKPASLEDQIICAAIALGLPIESIYSMSIRKFTKLLKRIDAKIHYEIYLTASMSGMVKFKDDSFIKHWLSDLTEDRWADSKVSYDEVEKKIH